VLVAGSAGTSGTTVSQVLRDLIKAYLKK
jgi:hypothetical protein